LITRRQFLRGDLAGRKAILRPPWALPEAAFLAACTRCKACLAACPTQILVWVRGYPEVQFSQGECTFCGACRDACVPQALKQAPDQQPPWPIKAVIANTCLAQRDVVCRSCSDACGESAIRFPPRLGSAALPELLATNCTGCGACVAACPANAISVR
jgi:ferredoxin-type protein NapF